MNSLTPDFQWTEILSNLGLLALAYGLALPIGWNRERGTNSAGLRTFPLVSIASCGFVLLGRSLVAGDAGAMARVIQGVMTGIGFIGGGAILKREQKGRVRGTATAASIWTTGAIGACVGLHRYEIALALAVATVVSIVASERLKGSVDAEEHADGSNASGEA